ncbi:MAG TPA: hypothetical protein VFD35_10110 [Pricia sp.]|nr:hypothetical protein [Pricia sp.]
MEIFTVLLILGAFKDVSAFGQLYTVFDSILDFGHELTPALKKWLHQKGRIEL